MERNADTDPSVQRPAAEAGSIHSNAYNFLSAVNTGVDPRTGMYSCSISLPGVAANNLFGPTVGVTLSFSALNPVDAGFGMGWSLTTSRYDTVQKRLSLSSGESFLVDTFVNGTATFKDRKLRTFDLIQAESSADFRVVYKAGHSEHLRVLPGSEGMAVLHELRSPEGYVVRLDQEAAGGIVKLRKITDATGRVLLSVAYEVYDTRVTLHPASPQAVTFTFHFTHHWLTGVDLPEGYGDGWVFGYEVRRAVRRSPWRRIRAWFLTDDSPKVELGLLLLKSVTVPTGGHEEVTYSYEGHALPGGSERPLSHMPYVTRFVRRPGHKQPDVDTGYEYSSQNFFGFGVLNDWLDGEDNLYRVVMPPGQSYEYSSIETLYDGGEPVRTIARTFNRFHLLTKEVSAQEGCIKQVVTIYDEEPDTSFVDQVPWCQLPIEVRITYSVVDGTASNDVSVRSREDVRTTRYDNHGNVLEATDERGASEVFSYFPIEGEEGQCPADTLGFVRSVREKCVRPPSGSEGPVRLTRYTYQTLESLVEGDASHVVPWTETLYRRSEGVADIEMGTTSQIFVGDRGPHHGRLKRVTSRHGLAVNLIDYAYSKPSSDSLPLSEKDALGVDTPVLITTTKRLSSNGRDRHHTEAVVAYATLSGLTVMDRSPNGVTMRYAHDALGRQVAETVAAESAWVATTTSTYELKASGTRIFKRSVTGQETIVELDGFGTAIRVLANNWNDDGNEREIWRASFDARGRKISESTTDAGLPVASIPQTITTQTTYLYDGWDNVTETHGADGAVGYHRVDPVAGTAERWEEADGPEGRMVSRRTRIQTTISGKPERVDSMDADGTVCVSQYSTYDGLDRLIGQVVSVSGEPDRITRYRYDDYDRLIETVRPDGAVITTGYADYTDAPLVTALWIRHVSLGEDAVLLGRQAYDGLGRRILFQAGQRQTTFHYDGPTSANPDRMTLPSGKTVAYRYEPHLGDRLLEATSIEGMTTFTYDATTGATCSVSNALGKHSIEYDTTGYMARETFHHEGVAEGKHCSYHYSLRGVLTDYTDVNGDLHKLVYDDIGRFIRMESDDLSVDVIYDAFSREQHTLTESRDGSRSMAIDLSLDEHGREVERVVTARTDEHVVVQALSQTYTQGGKLATRRLIREGTVRNETFAYGIRDRLATYTCDGEGAPKDETGRAVSMQVFTYDALDNVVERKTSYADGAPQEIRRFLYAPEDPTQLTTMIVEQGGQPIRQLNFTYDAGGHLQYDAVGRSLQYDALGRPGGWTRDGASRAYRYDADGRIGATNDGHDERHRYYLAGQISREEGKDTSATFHHVGGRVVAQGRTGGATAGMILLGGDSQGSVVAEAGISVTTPTYTVHGYDDRSEGQSDIGYTGELKERDVDWYVLGHYRAYSPMLMRFHSPDAASPFGHGGLNAYVYCSGDPVNRSDPSGEGWLDWLFVGIGAVAAGIGIVLSAGTLGPAFVAAVTLSANLSQATAVGLLVVDLASVALDIASAKATHDGNDALAMKLALGSMVLGAATLKGIGAKTVGAGEARAFTHGRRYVSASRVGEPTTIHVPPVTRPGNPPGLKADPSSSVGETLGGIGGATLRDADIEALRGIDLVNTAATRMVVRVRLLERGLVSRHLLDRFPRGIDLTNRQSVIRAREILSRALLNDSDVPDLNPEILARAGFDNNELLRLNPSRAKKSGETQRTLGVAEEVVNDAQHLEVSEAGELLYRRFLEAPSIDRLGEYAISLMRARWNHSWQGWNG